MGIYVGLLFINTIQKVATTALSDNEPAASVSLPLFWLLRAAKACFLQYNVCAFANCIILFIINAVHKI